MAVFCLNVKTNVFLKEPAMAFSGDLEYLSIVDVIQLLHTTRKTGTLKVQGRKGEISIAFSDGFIVGANHYSRGVMIGTILTETEAEKARVARMQQMGPEKIAPLSVFLLSEAAKDVTGQIFAVRMNEIFLMGQSRPLRSIHRDGGWTPQTIAEHGMPALKSSFYKLDRSADIFSWDAI